MSVMFEVGQEFNMELPGGKFNATVIQNVSEPESMWVIKVNYRYGDPTEDPALQQQIHDAGTITANLSVQTEAHETENGKTNE